MPGSVQYDPTDLDVSDDLSLIGYETFKLYMNYAAVNDPDFSEAIKKHVSNLGLPISDLPNERQKIVERFAKEAQATYQGYLVNAPEFVLDLAAVILPLTSTWVSYGPWFNGYETSGGMVSVEVDDSLVPWNFSTPEESEDWDKNLDEAGYEKLARKSGNLEYSDSASITVAGCPEFGLASEFGYNSNITNIGIDFSVGGVQTTYTLATYSARPGTYRKSDYDNLRDVIIAKERMDQPRININLDDMNQDSTTGRYGINKFLE
jgi:hypothetical protein